MGIIISSSNYELENISISNVDDEAKLKNNHVSPDNYGPVNAD